MDSPSGYGDSQNSPSPYNQRPPSVYDNSRNSEGPYSDKNTGELTTSPPTVTRAVYDPKGALTYARKYWNVPCDDNFIWTQTGAQLVPRGAIFVRDDSNKYDHEYVLGPNGAKLSVERFVDCTHFISCCIGTRPGQPCGGLPIGGAADTPYGFPAVQNLVNYLIRNKYGVIVAEKTWDDAKIDLLVPGDLIAYFHVESGVYHHLAIYLGNSCIACHSFSRSDAPECNGINSWALNWPRTLISMVGAPPGNSH